MFQLNIFLFRSIFETIKFYMIFYIMNHLMHCRCIDTDVSNYIEVSISIVGCSTHMPNFIYIFCIYYFNFY
jgi:hypothetical protein